MGGLFRLLLSLLRYPRRTISGEVAGHIADVLSRSAVVMQLWGPSDRWRLSEPVASQLSRVTREARQMVEFEFADNY
jgi:hypothetical protein